MVLSGGGGVKEGEEEQHCQEKAHLKDGLNRMVCYTKEWSGLDQIVLD